uniref:Ovomucoid n=1 Tax=Coturnix japonica TaxID=93934 RepID=A0A8C2YB36_COTJA
MSGVGIEWGLKLSHLCSFQASCSEYQLSGSGNLACPRIFQPVCGTDNVTYPNECSLCRQILLLNMFLLHYLQIDCSNFKRTDLYCTEEYVPHCGSDGVTYGNKCYFCIAVLKSHGSLSLQHLGEC